MAKNKKKLFNVVMRIIEVIFLILLVYKNTMLQVGYLQTIKTS